MATQIPSAEDVRAALRSLGRGQMQELADKSGVPVTTLSNIRNSSKQGPTVDTLRKFWPHLLRLTRKAAA
jgi:transcriptional regulator with XRE-family HTH domain